MIKAKYLPTYTAHSFYEIPSSFYLEQGLKNILLDLDNTLAPYKEKEPSEETKAWVSSLQKEGLHLYIASNNTSKRVTRYAKLLGVKALSGLLKPFAFRLKRILKEQGFVKSETVLIGDQIMTDVVSANHSGIRSILTDPLSPKEPWVTKWNRLFDTPKRKKMMKGHLVPSWKEKKE
jgi:HAD superfamily phosphatase (TIGR01668 family)